MFFFFFIPDDIAITANTIGTRETRVYTNNNTINTQWCAISESVN